MRWIRGWWPVIGAASLLGLTALVAVAQVAEVKAPSEEPPRYLKGEERTAFLRKVEKGMGGVQSFAAEFRQEKVLRLFKTSVKSWGFLLYSRPDSMRWEIREPFRSILVVAGQKVGKFEYAEEERRALKLGGGEKAILSVMNQIRSWFGGKFDAQEDIYDMDVAEQPRPVIVLRPRPNALKKNVQEIRVLLSADLSTIVKVTLMELKGDRTEMTFQEIRRNLILRDEIFSVTDPAEVDREALRKAPELTPQRGS